MQRALGIICILIAGLGCGMRVSYVPQPLPQGQDPLTQLELVLNQSTKPVEAVFGDGYFRAVYSGADSEPYVSVVTYREVGGYEFVGPEGGVPLLVVLQSDGSSMAAFLVNSRASAESLADAIAAVAQSERATPAYSG